MNIQCSQYLLFHRARTVDAGRMYERCPLGCFVLIKSVNLSNVENQKLLGIIIDKTLSWDSQIDSVCQKLTRRITLLKVLSKYVDKSSLKQYYNSYILPIFDYGCMIWGQCSLYNMNRLLKLQKRAARIILQADFMTPSQLMFQELGLPFINESSTI